MPARLWHLFSRADELPGSAAPRQPFGLVTDLPRDPPGQTRAEGHALRVPPFHPQIPEGLRGVLIGGLQDGEAVALVVFLNRSWGCLR